MVWVANGENRSEMCEYALMAGFGPVPGLQRQGERGGELPAAFSAMRFMSHHVTAAPKGRLD